MASVRCLQPTPASIPLFLAPAFADSSITSKLARRSFSTSVCNQARKQRDLNKRRGESVIRSTGPRHPLNVQKKYKELPKPQAEEDRPLDAFPTNPNHGLYGFFNKDKDTVCAPEREEQHGRQWHYQELVLKSFENLHAIYWQGLLEINRIRTRAVERKRLSLGYGELELKQRLATVKSTLGNIRNVLRDRQYAHEEAKLVREREGTIEKLDQWLAQQNQRALDPAKDGVPKIGVFREPEVSESPMLLSKQQQIQSLAGNPDMPVLPPRPSR